MHAACCGMLLDNCCNCIYDNVQLAAISVESTTCHRHWNQHKQSKGIRTYNYVVLYEGRIV